MLYKFKSKATADLVMLEPNGRRLLEIVGKAESLERGIIQPPEMKAAIAALQAAIVEEDRQRQALIEQAQQEGQPPPWFGEVSLRQRATPLLEMLLRCEKSGKEIVWGV